MLWKPRYKKYRVLIHYQQICVNMLVCVSMFLAALNTNLGLTSFNQKKMGSNCIINRYSWDFMAIYWNGFIYQDLKPCLFFASVRGSNETIILTERPWRWLTLILLYIRLNNEQTKQYRMDLQMMWLFPRESSSWIQLLGESMGINQHLEDQCLEAWTMANFSAGIEKSLL